MWVTVELFIKLFLCHEDVWGSRGIAPTILDLDTRSEWSESRLGTLERSGKVYILLHVIPPIEMLRLDHFKITSFLDATPCNLLGGHRLPLHRGQQIYLPQ
jgi:hypothetical protein